MHEAHAVTIRRGRCVEFQTQIANEKRTQKGDPMLTVLSLQQLTIVPDDVGVGNKDGFFSSLSLGCGNG